MLSLLSKLLPGSGVARGVPNRPLPANVAATQTPGYPPPPNGIPFLAPDRLLDKHDDLIATMRQTIGIADPLVEKLYLPAIRRMAGFVHLLPASESHHHRGAGGALRHAIEVATYATRASEAVMIGSMDLPVRRKQKETAWRYAAFLAGLCHDIGKPVTDLTAHVDGGGQWNPMADSLVEWGQRCGADHYYLNWQPNRHKMHEQFYAMLVSKIAGPEGIEYLGSIGFEAVGWVLSLNQAATMDQKKMSELVTKGDMLSVENDLRTHAGGASVAVAGINLEKVVQDALLNRFRLDIWSTNKLGSRAWKTASGVFLVWPIAGGEVVEDLSSMRAAGLPKTPEALLSFMIERGLAVPKAGDDGAEDTAVWKIKIPANNDLVATVTAIKLSEDSGIPAILSGIVPLPGESAAPPESPASGTAAPGPEEQMPDRTPEGVAPASAPRSTNTPLPSLEDMGPHGFILESVRADMQSGRKKSGEDYVRLNDGRVAIAYPDGLKGAGVEPSTMLEWLEENGMLETDPYQHDKKTHEIDGFHPPKRSRKALLLTRTATAQLGFAAAPEAQTEQKPARNPARNPAKGEDLPPLLARFVDAIKEAKTVGNTPFLVEESDEGLFVPRHTAVSWYLKRCGDKNARNEISAHFEAGVGVSEVQRGGKKMLFIPAGVL